MAVRLMSCMMWFGTMSRMRTRMVEVAAAAFHAYGFSNGNLHVIDVAAVPDGLEDSVGKAERHDVLHGLFAQIVVNTINLFFHPRA